MVQMLANQHLLLQLWILAKRIGSILISGNILDISPGVSWSRCLWNPDTLDETLGKCSYQYIPSMYLYMSVRKHINSMYFVCTSTGFSYMYVPSMYILKFICESMYQYVLARNTTVFCGMIKSPCDQMLQDTFQRYTRAHLSVLFRKILC